MRNNITDNNWQNVKGEIKKTWVNLSSKEIDETKGNTEAVTTLLSQKCGLSHQDAERKLEDVIARCGTEATGFNRSADSKKMHEPESRFEADGGRTTSYTEPTPKGAGSAREYPDQQKP